MAGQGAWSSNRPWRPTGGRTSSPTSLTEMAEKMEVLGSSLREREREPRVVTPVIRPFDLTLVTITEVVPVMALPPCFPPGCSRAPTGADSVHPLQDGSGILESGHTGGQGQLCQCCPL